MADPFNYNSLYGTAKQPDYAGPGAGMPITKGGLGAPTTGSKLNPSSVLGDPNAGPNAKLKALLDYESGLLANNPYALAPTEQQQQRGIDQAVRQGRSQIIGEQTAATRAALGAPDFRQQALQEAIGGSQERMDKVQAEALGRNQQMVQDSIKAAYDRTIDGLISQREFNAQQTQMWLQLGLGTAATIGGVVSGLGVAGIIGGVAANTATAAATAGAIKDPSIGDLSTAVDVNADPNRYLGYA